MTDLRGLVETLQWRLDDLSRQIGWVTKGNLIHVYGSDALEKAFIDCVETE